MTLKIPALLGATVSFLIATAHAQPAADAPRGDVAADRARCEALTQAPNLTITAARLVEPQSATPPYCYAKGTIPPGIALSRAAAAARELERPVPRGR